VKKGHNSYLVIDVMTGFHNQLNSWVTSCSMAVSQTLSFCAEWDLATLGYRRGVVTQVITILAHVRVVTGVTFRIWWIWVWLTVLLCIL